MKWWNNLKKENWFSLAFAICIGVTFYMLLSNIGNFANFFSSVWTVVKPLLYGLIIAYLVDPIARFYQVKLFSGMKNQSVARKIAVVMALITVLAVIVLIIVAVVPPFAQSIITLINHATTLIEELEMNSGDISSILPAGISNMFSNLTLSNDTISKISGYFSRFLTGVANASLSAGSGFANLLIAFVLAIYYLMDKTRLQTLVRRFFIIMLKEDKYISARDFILKVDNILLSYIKGNVLEALIVGVVNWIFMMIADMPYAILISIIVGITNIAPTFGPIVGAVLGALLLLIENPMYALIFLIFTVVLQTVDGYILKPRLMGDTLGVSPLLIIIMIILGGRVFGVVGILIAIPFSAIATTVAGDLWNRYKIRKNIKEPDPEE